MNWREPAQTLTITLAAMAVSLLLFAVFMAFAGVPPDELFRLMYASSFGSSFARQNTLSRAAPLILTALCCALPARVGLVIIGGEGALVLGGLAAAMVGLGLAAAPPFAVQAAMIVAGMVVGALLILVAGGFRYYRGVNETISSLLLNYIVIAVFKFLVEDWLRNPDDKNKPATYPIPTDAMIGNLFGMDVNCGLAFGIVFCLIAYFLMYHTTFGFAVHMVGGNVRAAQSAGLPVGKLLLITCALGGAAAGLAGTVQVAAIHQTANPGIIANYGYMGILVSFLARHHPLGIIPVAILFGGLDACSGRLQRLLNVPQASILVLMGILFLTILLFETLHGRFRIFQPREIVAVDPKPAVGKPAIPEAVA